ncbi:aldo/keto reductase [Streptomyces sp. N2-109]|uniref:Aldo/keto reductase n=1 Tax=Streptomyces gossypii TaxID=2883101 RepID=A0ABT2JQH9_9ACTN|nr:aldo/keto reductase [Streptomyces gossypii]MCT2590121.1 aldo/keto reductase [Streptomyces gossypii]
MKPDARVTLGRTGLQVTPLGLGLASIGGLFTPVSEEQARATVDRAWELGLRLFDTAPVYGYGRSEARAGRALRARQRAEMVLCTKVGRLIEPGGPDTQPIWADPPPGVGPRRDHSYDAVLRSVEESMERVGVDRFDVLHIHDPDEDYATALHGAYPALAGLRRRGAVRAVSLGVNHADVAARFLREAPEPGPDCVLLAGRYSVLDQSGLEDLLPLCEERGVAVIAAGVFQGGLLTGTTAAPPALAARIQALRAVCERYGTSPLAVATQFPLAHPAVSTVLVGARTPAEVSASAEYFAHPVPDALWAALKSEGLLPREAPVPGSGG